MLHEALAAFALIFLAEFGDKTQLAVLALASRGRSPVGVAIGAGSALLLTTLIAVGVGGTLSRFLPEPATHAVRYVAGALFIAVGVFTIWKA